MSLYCFLAATSFLFSFWPTCQKGVHSSSLPITTAILCHGLSSPVLHGWRRCPGTSRVFIQFHLQLLTTPYFLLLSANLTPALFWYSPSWPDSLLYLLWAPSSSAHSLNFFDFDLLFFSPHTSIPLIVCTLMNFMPTIPIVG